MITKKELKDIFRGDIIGKDFILFDETTSTNDRAIEIGLQDERSEGTVIIANSQTQGRGRLGRNWVSPPDVNLYFTVLLKPPFPPKEATLLTLAAAVSVATAINLYPGLPARIKWPNDILIDGKKAAGILMEMRSSSDRINFLALGTGINVNMTLNSLPEEILPFTTSLNIEYGSSVNSILLLGKALAELEVNYKLLLKGEKGNLIKKWLDLNCTTGEMISVNMQDRILSGTAEGVNEYGELILRLSSGEIETVNSGDVTIVKGVRDKGLRGMR